MRPAAADPLERRPLGGAQPPLDEQVAVPINSSPTFCSIRFLRRAARLAAFELGRPRGNLGAGRQTLAFLGHGRGADRLVHLVQDVELADLMRHRTEDCGDRLGIQRRAVGRDPLEDQPACLQGRPEAAEERLDVDLGRVAVQDVVGQPFEGAVIDDRQDTERAVIQLVGGDKPEKSESAQSR